MNNIKSERLSLRLDKFSKQKIELAAAIQMSTINSFMISSALEKANEIIQQNEQMILSQRDRDIFLEALLNPPSPNKALSKAFVNHSIQVDSDV